MMEQNGLSWKKPLCRGWMQHGRWALSYQSGYDIEGNGASDRDRTDDIQDHNLAL